MRQRRLCSTLSRRGINNLGLAFKQYWQEPSLGPTLKKIIADYMNSVMLNNLWRGEVFHSSSPNSSAVSSGILISTSPQA